LSDEAPISSGNRNAGRKFANSFSSGRLHCRAADQSFGEFGFAADDRLEDFHRLRGDFPADAVTRQDRNVHCHRNSLPFRGPYSIDWKENRTEAMACVSTV